MAGVDSEKPQNITNNIFTTGRLKGLPVDEQSLILKGDKGQYVLAGCSHSTVKQILNSSKKHGKINGIIGGFHGFSDYDILKNLDLIIPCHCTKHIKEILNIYPEKSQSGGVGKVIEI